MGQAQVSFGRFIGGPAGPRDIVIRFKADAQQGGAELFGQVEIGCYIAQGIGALCGVFGDGEIAGQHRDGQLVVVE